MHGLASPINLQIMRCWILSKVISTRLYFCWFFLLTADIQPDLLTLVNRITSPGTAAKRCNTSGTCQEQHLTAAGLPPASLAQNAPHLLARAFWPARLMYERRPVCFPICVFHLGNYKMFSSCTGMQFVLCLGFTCTSKFTLRNLK